MHGSNPGVTGSLAADVSFVRLNHALEFQAAFREQLADLMSHPPRTLVRHAKLALKFLGRYAVLAGRHEEHGEEPRFERSGGLVEDRSSGRINLIPAFTSVGAALFDGVEVTLHAATLTSRTFRMALRVDVCQAIGVVLELGVELFDRVLHAPTVR